MIFLFLYDEDVMHTTLLKKKKEKNSAIKMCARLKSPFTEFIDFFSL